MDIFALPTRMDMSPWAAIEAASVGLPVVSSQIAGLGEIVLHEKTGLLCPPNDDAASIAAIERLMSDPQLRTAMVRYSFMVQAYVWGEPDAPTALPAPLAAPMWALAKRLGHSSGERRRVPMSLLDQGSHPFGCVVTRF
jgi:hypothetical protein